MHCAIIFFGHSDFGKAKVIIALVCCIFGLFADVC